MNINELKPEFGWILVHKISLEIVGKYTFYAEKDDDIKIFFTRSLARDKKDECHKVMRVRKSISIETRKKL